MEFKRYASIPRNIKIDNSSLSFDVQYLLSKGYGETKCVYQQKVHGSNIAVYYNGDKYKVSKRSKFISESDNFFGGIWIELLEEVKEPLDNIYQDLKKLFPHMTHAAFHAELAGGNYGNKKEGKLIQGNTDYHEKNFFYFFDIRIFWEDDNGVKTKLISPTKSVPLFEKYSIFHAKILGEGTLYELLQLKDFKNYVSKELSGGQLRESEGIVIKSIDPDKLYIHDKRIVVKVINPAFDLTKKEGGKEKKKEVEISLEVYKYSKAFESLCTEVNLGKCLGNMGISEDNFTPKKIGEILKFVIEDIHGDLSELYPNITPQEKKYVNKLGNRDIINLLKKRFNF